VVLVVELHDFAGDGWLEGAVVVWNRVLNFIFYSICTLVSQSYMEGRAV
jgi:hypothetical protein